MPSDGERAGATEVDAYHRSSDRNGVHRIPNEVVMVSPSATTRALSTIEDKGYFFRTAPSDARQGGVLAQVATTGGIKAIAVAYTDHDYGKGLTNSFSNAFKAAGGKRYGIVRP